jgi:hypothetical protein
MRKLTPVDMKPWTLPLAVLGLVLPIAVATLVVGSVGAFVAGAVMAALLIVIAARTTYDEEIEVAPATDGRYHLLVVVTTAIEEPKPLEAIADAARRGAERPGSREGPPELLVLAPALNPGLAHWASDLREARLAAQDRLAITLAGLAAAGLEASGQVGDSEPIQAIEDELRSFPAQEVLLATSPGEERDLLDDLRRRLDRPVRDLHAGGSLSGARRSGA